MGRIDPTQLEETTNDVQALHKSMKNAIEVVFATSPLLALSTHGWASRSFHSTYLLRVSNAWVAFLIFEILTLNKTFLALGNNRPQILVHLEDCVLEAIAAISEGKRHEDVLQTLYSEGRAQSQRFSLLFSFEVNHDYYTHSYLSSNNSLFPPSRRKSIANYIKKNPH